jgi:hypothetical protein
VVRTISSKNTKAQILEAFEELYAEHQQVQIQRDQLLQDKEALEERLSELGVAPAVGEGKAYTIDIILAGLTTLRAGFGSAISELSAKLTAKVTRLEELRRQVEAETHQLEELHDLTIAEHTLDDLIQAYEEQSRAFQEEAKQKRAAFEKEMAEKREAWKAEQKEHASAVKERDESLKKARQRNNQEFKYDLDMARKLDAEQYDQKKEELYRALEELVAAKEKEWAAREKEIAEQEEEYQGLKARVEAFPRELEAAIKQADKEGTDMARKEAKVRDDLLAKEEEGHRRVAELEVQALQETIEVQTQRIAALSAQLDAVTRQSQDLAVKAIEGAARETSFQSIREIALEQAKNLPKSK